MKRFILFLFVITAITIPSFAQSADAILSSAAERFNAAQSISAEYTIRGNGSTSNGKIIISGEKFAISSPEISSWYDGTTQWTYSPSIGEVNITEPSTDELQQINPFAIISHFRTSYKATKLKSSKGSFKVELRPIIDGVSITHAIITFNASTYMPSLIVLTMDNNASASIDVTSIKSGGNHPESTFVFNEKQFPQASIIDLR